MKKRRCQGGYSCTAISDFGLLLLSSAGYGQAKATRPQTHFWQASKQESPESPVILQLSKHTFRFSHSSNRQGIPSSLLQFFLLDL